MNRLISFYGDDFTGSTDVMEALSSHGIKTILFTRIPTDLEFAPYADYDAVGIAGTSRSQTPDWMTENLLVVFQWLKTLQAKFCHYKVCSTFDSSPTIGSIGRALEIGAGIFDQSTVPLIVGAPQLKRYTFAGHLFAGYQGQTYRIDRHPVMSRHPVTPMDESDLRRHLARQTSTQVEMIDVHDATTQLAAGELLLQNSPPFLVGSSGVEYALVRALTQQGQIAGSANYDAVPAVDRMVVVSGSVSPTTERQIRYALQHGFTGVELDPLAPDIASTLLQTDAILQNGGSPLIYTALGPASDKNLTGDRSSIGRALGTIARHCVRRHGLNRVVVAGGDTSSHALTELDVLTLETRFPLSETPGSPLCTAKSAQGNTIEIALKGGQVGGDDYFVKLRDGLK
jgi:3-oxoisoapionate kinase